MEKYIKNSVLVIVVFYALYAAIVGVLYVMNTVEQAVMTDWLLKGLYVALIVLGLSLVISFVSQRSK
ncbi:MAG: hypothetical protein WAU02_00855 [Candidatus Saccharimonadales bacterium]